MTLYVVRLSEPGGKPLGYVKAGRPVPLKQATVYSDPASARRAAARAPAPYQTAIVPYKEATP